MRSPPTTTAPWRSASGRDALVQEPDVGGRRCADRDEKVVGETAHRGDVTDGRGHRPPPEVVEAHEPEIRVHSFDHGVDREQQRTFPGLHDRRVVAYPDLARRRRRQHRLDRREHTELAATCSAGAVSSCHRHMPSIGIPYLSVRGPNRPDADSETNL